MHSRGGSGVAGLHIAKGHSGEAGSQEEKYQEERKG